MKRLLTIALALIFLAPVCEGVLAYAPMDMGHNKEYQQKAAGTSESHEFHEASARIETENTASDCESSTPEPSSGMDCCDTNSDHFKIGIQTSGPTEKIIRYIKIGFAPTSDYPPSELSEGRKSHYSTAPPENRQSYANLVGIIKDLN